MNCNSCKFVVLIPKTNKVKLKWLTIQKVIIFTVHLFLCNIIFAQSEDSTKITRQDVHLKKKLTSATTLFNFQPSISDQQIFNKLNTAFLELFHLNYKSGENILFKNVLFRQSKTCNVFHGLGNYEHFNNSFIYNTGNKMTFDVGFGLAKQSTILNSKGPNIQFSFHTIAEYSITNWLSAYLSGQYITSPINKSKVSFDPFLYMNPLFLQTETRGGLSAKFKNIKADIGVKTMYDTQFKQIKPISTINSKVTIGF